MRAALTHPASKLSKTSLRLAVFVCYVLVVKRIIFKTNFLFWIFLAVVYGFIYSHEREQIQDNKYQAFYQRGKCETLKGVNVVMYWWWMQGNGAWKQSGGDANILLLNVYVLPALSSQLSVFSKLCIMNTLLHFLLLCQSCHCLRSVSFGGRILGLIKVLITVGWVWWRYHRGPPF